ncbi:MAG: hypothetical protein HYZ54_05145 [Ignavibacteriae bacterium]|nr:hypothetical protein [Ignavibacteriota bacterium]
MNYIFGLYSLDILFTISCLCWGFSSSAFAFETKRRKLYYSGDPSTRYWAVPGDPAQTHSWSGLMNLYVIVFIFVLPFFSSTPYLKLFSIYLIGATVYSLIGRALFRVVFFTINFAHFILSIACIIATIILPIVNLIIKVF